MGVNMRRALQVALVTVILGSVVDAASYSDWMKKTVQSIFGPDLKAYTFSTYPTDNFGIGTAYTSDDRAAKIDDRNFVCATLQCLGIKQQPEDPATKLGLAGFAAIGQGGPVKLDDKTQRQLAISAVLPKVVQILGITAKFDRKSVKTSTITFSDAKIRKLNRGATKKHIESLPQDSALRQAFTAGNLVLIVADVVVSGLEVKVTLDTSRGAELAAKLDKAVGTAIGEGASLSLNVSRTQAGEYVLKGNSPLVVAVLPKRQPAAGALGAAKDDNWSDWEAVKTKTLKNTGK